LIAELQKSITIAENTLNILCSNLPSEITNFSTLSDVDLPANLAAGVPANLLSLPPDVKTVELELIRFNYRGGFTRAAMYTSFTTSEQAGVNALSFSNWFNIPASLFGLATA